MKEITKYVCEICKKEHIWADEAKKCEEECANKQYTHYIFTNNSHIELNYLTKRADLPASINVKKDGLGLIYIPVDKIIKKKE